MDLLKSRTEPSFKRFEAIILGLYTALVATITHYHEPWSDEAQAWLIARDSGLRELFLKRLHYEGTPGLWHLLLWILARMHFSFAAMHWATALIGIATAYLILHYSPFPPLVRAILPFTFPLVFQTAIIARSYSLVPLLSFLICIAITAKRNRPLLLAVLIGLLANTSLLAFMLALGVIPLYVLELRALKLRPSKQSLIFSGAILGLLLLFAIYTALPAPDISFAPGAKFASHPHIGSFLSKVTGIPLPPHLQPIVELAKRPSPPNLSDEFARKYFASHLSLGHQFLRGVNIISLAFFSVSRFNLLAILFYATLLLWQTSHRALVTLLPFLMLLAGGYPLGFSEHHISLIATALIMSLWLTWSRASIVSPNRLDLIFQIILLAVIVEQAAWTAHAAIFDIRGPFDGSVATAHFILPKIGNYRVDSIGADPISIQPYATHNIFSNQTSTYWPWRVGADPDTGLTKTLTQHPDFILDSEAFTGDTLWNDQIIKELPEGQIYDLRDKATYLKEHGYRETHRFCGRQPAQFGFSRKTCYLVYEPIHSLNAGKAGTH